MLRWLHRLRPSSRSAPRRKPFRTTILRPTTTRRTTLGPTLLATAAIVLAACSGSASNDAPSAPAEDTTTDPAQSVAINDDAQVGPPDSAPDTLQSDPLIWIVPREVRQGNAFIIAIDAPGAGFASAAFNGQVITMLREGSRFFTIFGIDALTPVGPLPVVISVADAAGNQVLRRETLVEIFSADWQVEVVELDEFNQDLLNPAIIREDAEARQPVQSQETPERHWDGIFDPPTIGVLTSNYGLLRSYNFAPAEEYHGGLDFAGELGDPVLSPNAGVIAWVGQTQRRGNGVLVDHGGGIFTGYYHMSESLVAVGDVVRTGDFIGRIGATGLATGPHLHWEVVVHGITVDPVQWIRTNELPNPVGEFDALDALPLAEFGAG